MKQKQSFPKVWDIIHKPDLLGKKWALGVSHGVQRQPCDLPAKVK